MAKTLLWAGLAAAAVASISTAQAAPADWSGLYIGVNGGGSSVGVDGQNDLTCTTACNYFFSSNAAVLQNEPEFSPSGAGSAFGVQAGWNGSLGNGLMWGIEADIDSSDFGETESHSIDYVTAPGNGNTFTNQVETDWTATVRLRAGMAAGDNALVYVTGGVAFADATLTTDIVEYVGCCAVAHSEQSDTLTGWTLGAGAEWAFDSNWSIKLEYLYEDFGSISSDTDYTDFGETDVFHTTADLTANVVRVGINYGF